MAPDGGGEDAAGGEAVEAAPVVKAKKKPVDVKNAGALGVTAGPMTVVKEMSLPPARQAGKIIAGDDAKAKAAALAKALHEEVKII